MIAAATVVVSGCTPVGAFDPGPDPVTASHIVGLRDVAASAGVVTPAAVAQPTVDYGRDRIDQRGNLLDGRFRYASTGDGVHV
jgi:hypothetical protein